MREIIPPIIVILTLVLIGVLIGMRKEKTHNKKLAHEYCLTQFEKTVDANKCLSELGVY